MHLGLICPELSGHLNPMTTLGRELQRRGHQVTVVARLDARRKAEAAGLGFAPFGEREYPEGSMAKESAQVGRLGGIAAVRFTAEMLRRAAEISLHGAPDVIAREKIDALLIDQVTPAGGTVAERLGLSFVTICDALAMNPDPALPPGVMPWPYAAGLLPRIRNAFGNAVLQWLATPVVAEINRHRAAHGFRALSGGLTDGSKIAQIAQQPAFFDFPRTTLPDCFHYTGPWHDDASGDPIPFPWERLDGRPLIYASMGTLQNRQQTIFQTIAAACAGLEAQLVISLGSRDQDASLHFAGNPIVVPFAPQLALLDRAALSITHAGLNTALESLAHGLPMVAIPITNDQPGVAARLAWLGVAEVVPPRGLTVERLRAAIERVLRDPSYRENARRRQQEIAQLNGLSKAADLVERALTTRAPVLRTSSAV